MCVCWDGCWGAGWVHESNMSGGGDDFLVSLGILRFGVGLLRFTVAVDGVVVVGCEVVGVRLVDFGVMVLKLDSSIVRRFCLEWIFACPMFGAKILVSSPPWCFT